MAAMSSEIWVWMRVYFILYLIYFIILYFTFILFTSKRKTYAIYSQKIKYYIKISHI